MQVCRVCLAMDVRMYQLSNQQELSAMYARVTGVQINAGDMLPQQLCWECAARLSSANHFIQKALRSQWILFMKMNNTGVLSMSDIISIDRAEHQLESRLGSNFINVEESSSHIYYDHSLVTNIKTEPFEYPKYKEQKPKIALKEENKTEATPESTDATQSTKDETKKKLFICDICDKPFHRKCNLVQHIQKHPRYHKCTFCEYKSLHRTNLRLHINSQHTKSTSYNCSHCSYKSCYKSDLSKHINSKHIKNTYSCTYCSYKTCRKSSLNQHINCRHTKSISYDCTYCSFKTYRKGDLNNHINSQHTKKTSYNCYFCGFLTYYSKSLSQHIKSKHH